MADKMSSSETTLLTAFSLSPVKLLGISFLEEGVEKGKSETKMISATTNKAKQNIHFLEIVQPFCDT